LDLPKDSAMAKLDAPEVAALLAEYGRRSALRGGNPYRSKAYMRAAENLAALAEPLDRIVDEGRLQEIPGVGDAIADIVAKLHRTGSHPSLEKLRKEVPEGVLEMLSIPGLRPDKVLELHKELGIGSIEELETAAKQDRLKAVKGLGAALQRKILQGIEITRTSKGARHIHRAAALLDVAKKNLARSHLGLTCISDAGDFRRGAELVSDLAVVAESAHLKDGPAVLKNGDLVVHLTDKRRYGITQILATGSSAHLDELRKLANSKGLDITENGLRRRRKIVAAKSEAAIYKALGLQFIEPELREGRGEVAVAAASRLPKLVTDGDIRGILHAHTDRSDGVNTLEQMAEATRKRGYEYFGVADHSKSAHYAGGLSVDEIAEQQAEADRLNRKYGSKFRIFKGIESDILPDGSLDYPDDVLRSFDFIVASVHGQFRKDKREQTDRILRAVSHPLVTILGHMTGRQLLRRPGYEVDIDKILAACAQHHVAVEINANPWRLDLDWRWHGRALELGCMMSINPDAHSTSEIDLTHWGVKMARKGGVPANRVLNAMDLSSISKWIQQGKRSPQPSARSGSLVKPRRRPPSPRRQRDFHRQVRSKVSHAARSGG
jgi:DNA polymerase (family 10)